MDDTLSINYVHCWLQQNRAPTLPNETDIEYGPFTSFGLTLGLVFCTRSIKHINNNDLLNFYLALYSCVGFSIVQSYSFPIISEQRQQKSLVPGYCSISEPSQSVCL